MKSSFYQYLFIKKKEVPSRFFFLFPYFKIAPQIDNRGTYCFLENNFFLFEIIKSIEKHLITFKKIVKVCLKSQ